MAEELVSALLDGECTAPELRQLLAEAAYKPELMQQWSRMSLVRDALAGKPVQRPVHLNADAFCAGIMAQLGEMEPAAGALAPLEAAPIPAKIIPMPTRQRPSTAPRRARRPRPLVGWAAAASFTLVALAGGRAWFGSASPTSSPVAATPMASLNNAGIDSSPREFADSGLPRGGLIPVSAHSYLANTEEPSEVRWTQLDPETARELSGYMLEHNNSRADQGMNGALGYARLAARNVEYRSSNEPH